MKRYGNGSPDSTSPPSTQRLRPIPKHLNGRPTRSPYFCALTNLNQKILDTLLHHHRKWPDKEISAYGQPFWGVASMAGWLWEAQCHNRIPEGHAFELVPLIQEGASLVVNKSISQRIIISTLTRAYLLTTLLTAYFKAWV